MIEALVAVLIFSFGFLGFVGLQARALQFAIGAEDTDRAALLASELASTMVTRNTMDPDVLKTEITAWQQRASSLAGAGLHGGAASVARAGNVATIRITWRAAGTTGSATATAPANQYVTQVILP